MQRVSHDLSYEECEAWMRDLKILDDGEPDWNLLIKDAGIGGTPYNLKKRWNDGAAPKQREAIRALLEKVEQKKGPTPTGALIRSLEDWNEAGRALARNPEEFARELERVKALAAIEIKRLAARQLLAEADRDEAAVLGSPTPTPKKSRK